MMNQAKGYLALAAYILITRAMGLGFWHMNQESRPYWLAGAVIVLMLAVFWKRQPEHRYQRSRH